MVRLGCKDTRACFDTSACGLISDPGFSQANVCKHVTDRKNLLLI
jgi:hypothetical protein